MRVTDRDGREDALMGKTLQLPPCGCTITGAGTLPDPVRIVFCDTHANITLASKDVAPCSDGDVFVFDW